MSAIDQTYRELILGQIKTILESGQYALTGGTVTEGAVFETRMVSLDLPDGGFMTLYYHPRTTPRDFPKEKSE